MQAIKEHTDQVRSFNRFYTRQIGLLREGLLETPFSLTQARVLYELGQRPDLRSTNLVSDLGLDPGYVSRLLKKFEKQGLVKRSQARDDGRVHPLVLTSKGRREYERLNARSGAKIGEMLNKLDGTQQQQLVRSMAVIRNLLVRSPDADRTFELRSHRPGDIGWVVARHGELYAEEYGWDVRFEGLVAEIAEKFLTQFDESRERCWIAERSGERLGCVFLVSIQRRRESSECFSWNRLRGVWGSEVRS